MIGRDELIGLSKLIDLKIEEKSMPIVLENLQRMEQVAALVDEIALGPEDELGPEWRP